MDRSSLSTRPVPQPEGRHLWHDGFGLIHRVRPGSSKDARSDLTVPCASASAAGTLGARFAGRQGVGTDRFLPASLPPEDPTRILALVPRARYAGLAVVDRWGLVPHGFGAWNLHVLTDDDARRRAVRERLTGALARFRPALVVLAGAERHECKPLVRMAKRVVAEMGLESELAEVGGAKALLLGQSGAPRRDLPRRIVEGFFPELRARLTGDPERERYWRAVFQAAALALAALARRGPYQAAALAHAKAFDRNDLARALARAALTHDRRL